MKCKYKERGTHYGVSMDIVANMVATRSSTSSILLQYPTPKCSTQLWNNKQYNKNGTPSFPSGPIFNRPDSHLGLGLGFLHASTPINVRVLDPLESS
jgi:hypothetical protein